MDEPSSIPWASPYQLDMDSSMGHVAGPLLGAGIGAYIYRWLRTGKAESNKERQKESF